jgi:ribosomal protein S18 acetylase RimI-like enzyme
MRKNMDKERANVSAINGALELDRAVATLALAFSTDPVARWMYSGDPYQYLFQAHRLFRALAAPSFEANGAHRTQDGVGVVFWLPPGVHGDDEPVEAVIVDSVATSMQTEVALVFEQTEAYRPKYPHWYLSLVGVEVSHRNRGYGTALLQHTLQQCDREHMPAYVWSSNADNLSLYEKNGFDVLGKIQAGSSPPVFPMLRQAR